MWAQADDGFRRSVGEDYVATLPSGRKMRYENVCGSIVIEKDKVTGKPRRNTKYSATIGGKRRLFYGGKIIENIVQAIARDVFANHIVSMDKLGWRNLFSVHDEAVLEVESSVAANDVQREMSVCPDWLQGCPLAAEAKEISHYEK
jgi:DNA polymerase